MKTLDDKVDKLSSDQLVDADRRDNDGRGVKRKRTKALLLIQVSLMPLQDFILAQSRFIAYNSLGRHCDERLDQKPRPTIPLIMIFFLVKILSVLILQLRLYLE